MDINTDRWHVLVFGVLETAEMNQPTLWDIIEDAIATADQNADDEWKKAAYTCIRQCVLRHTEFTSDDVIEMLEKEWAQVTTHNLSALGGLFQKAQRVGLIENTGRMEYTRLPQRHRKITVWRSIPQTSHTEAARQDPARRHGGLLS